ncbi:hypothetical protein HMSSN036_74760 [Paenibacillus macerans]|nr:hypothetical protein HMSSN036_74760 [Paenibacillus macerans]
MVFTSGATESNNMIIKGVADYYGKQTSNNKFLLTSKVEHPSVIETFKYLEERDFSVKFLGVDQFARVIADQVRETVSQNKPLLTSIMWATTKLAL